MILQMNVFELLFFCFELALSAALAKVFYRQIGYWGILPAVLLGFGLLQGSLRAIRSYLASRNSRMRNGVHS